MNKNVVGVVLIVIAIAAFGFYGWPRLKPYVTSPPAQPAEAGAGAGATEEGRDGMPAPAI